MNFQIVPRYFFDEIPKQGVKVEMGKVLDGLSDHIKDYEDKYTFLLSDEKELEKEDIVSILKEREVDILLNYLPVGSEQATKFYAQCALEANVAFINNIPVFIASDKNWAKKI